MKKIAIITPFLARGGLEKMALYEAEELNKKFDVTLIVLDSFIQDYPYRGKLIDVGVSLENRNIIMRFINILITIFKLYRIKKKNKYDVAISHGELANLPNVLSGGKKNILTIHGNRFSSSRDVQGKLVNHVINYLYAKENVAKIVTVSEGIKESYISELNIHKKHFEVIYNPHKINEIDKLSNELLEEYINLFEREVIISVGRLTHPKAQWYLLRIFSQLLKSKPNIKLVILGDGYLREKLYQLSLDLDMKTYAFWKNDNVYNESYNVYFLGFQTNPYKFIKKAKIYVTTSLTEGLPNTIIESLACGTPVISTDCKTGPREILSLNSNYNINLTKPSYEEYGILMPQFEDKFLDGNTPLLTIEQIWVNTLFNLLNNSSLLKQYSEKSKIRAQDFDKNIIMNKWINIINNIMEE